MIFLKQKMFQNLYRQKEKKVKEKFGAFNAKFYPSINAPTTPPMISGMLKNTNVGTQVSYMWLCSPSAFRPLVGPSVLSLAGLPASPRAAAIPTSKMIAGTPKPRLRQSGT